jgi:hypothetical protein
MKVRSGLSGNGALLRVRRRVQVGAVGEQARVVSSVSAFVLPGGCYTKIIHANESNYKRGMVAAPTRGRAADARQEKVAGEYVQGTPEGAVGPTEAALAGHSHGGVVGLVFGAFGECSQSAGLLVGSFGKFIGEPGYAEMGHRTPEVGVGVATWAIRREWSMTHWREAANLSHVAELRARDGSVLGARQGEAVYAAPRRVGRRTPRSRTHRANGTSRNRNHRAPGATGTAGVRAY